MPEKPANRNPSKKRRLPRPKRLLALAKQAEAAQITAEWDQFEDEWVLKLHLPNGRDKRQVTFWTDDTWRLDYLEQVDISKYTFLGDYEAIASYDDDSIEAAVSSQGIAGPSVLVDRVIRRLPGVEELEPTERQASDRVKPLKLALASPRAHWNLELSAPSDVYIGLAGRGAGVASRQLTLKINGLPIERHDQALRRLEQISNSLFFDLDVRYDVLVRLQRSNRPFRSGTLRGKTEEPVQFPKSSYPREPLALYWYARSARGMPLLQYLAYYQTLEYYFPLYAHAEALQRLRNELRDPRFSLENDAHLDRILSFGARSKTGFGNEREQLKATLAGCLDLGDLETSLTTTEEVREHFSGKQRIGGVRQIVFENRQVDLRDQVADRIYDLRCRIVHTKEEGDKSPAGLLLPYSSEVNLLGYDIELVRLAAQKVLIAHSTSLRSS